MSVYHLAPCPPIAVPEITFATWENGFSNEQIDSIIKTGECLLPEVAGLDGGRVEKDIRKSKTSWIKLNSDTAWLYDSLGYIIRQLNGQFFDFDLYGFVEDMQYTVYDTTDSHYTWHLDRGGLPNKSPRKLSIVLQLSDPNEYKGGDLELFDGAEPQKIKKEKGLVVAFPSFVLHRVTPLTEGIRRTLVVWISGPRFR